jgi:hypothetical protein
MTDTNIDNYTVDDILLIFNLTEPTPFNVKDVANSLIAKMKSEGRTDLENFFTQARDKVLEYLLSDTVVQRQVENEATEGLSKIWKDGGVVDQGATPTVYFRDAERMVIEEQKTSGAASSAPPIISTHYIIIDSQYRSNILPYSSNPAANSFNTNYTFNLSNPITKVVSLALYSFQIPTSWYAFNAKSGNTFFMYNGFIIQIPDGNYSTAQSLVTTINTQAALQSATSGLIVTADPTTNIISFKNNDLISGPITVVFYIQANVINYNNCGNFTLSQFQTLGINYTLGWYLGFRTPANSVTGDVNLIINPGQTVSADVLPQVNGSSYFYLNIEDYSNQRLTNGSYNITNTKSYAKISIPDYYNTINVACKLREGTLTQAQLYAINAVTESSRANNNVSGFINKLTGPTFGNTFATIPLDPNIINNIRPNPYVKFGADLVINKRRYIAPTNLERLSVSLTDDKGNLVDLHDNDWSFTLLVEERLN